MVKVTPYWFNILTSSSGTNFIFNRYDYVNLAYKHYHPKICHITAILQFLVNQHIILIVLQGLSSIHYFPDEHKDEGQFGP